MEYRSILTERRGPVGTIAFNRPQVLNALSKELIREAGKAMLAFNADPEIRVVIIRGEGRSFSAGFDLSEYKDAEDSEKLRYHMDTELTFLMQFWDSPKVTIAAVHGHCLALGFELALCCDMTIAGENTRFGEPEVRFGAGIVAMMLPWVTGPKQAKQLLLTGTDRVTAARARDLGIVNEVVPDDQVQEAAMKLATEVATANEAAVALTKRSINRAYEIAGMKQALQVGLDAYLHVRQAPRGEWDMFHKLRIEQGLKAAIAWRDARFRDIGL